MDIYSKETVYSAEDYIKAADMIDAAADLINEKGLAKGNYVDLDGQYCTLGALRHLYLSEALGLTHSTFHYTLSMSLLRDYIANNFKLKPEDDIPTWNDNPRRTKNSVVKTLHKAANAIRKTKP